MRRQAVSASKRTEAFEADSNNVVEELVGLLLVHYCSRDLCVVIRAEDAEFSLRHPEHAPSLRGM